MCKNCPDKFGLLRKIEDVNSADSPASSSCVPPPSGRDSVNFELVIIVCWDNCDVLMPPISIASNPTPASSHPSRIQASESKLRNSSASNQRQTSTLASSHPPRIQASESKLRISIASNLHSGFVASKLRNPSFDLRLHQTSTPASSHEHRIQASEPRVRASESKLRISIASNLTDIASKLRNRRIQTSASSQLMHPQRHRLRVVYIYR